MANSRLSPSLPLVLSGLALALLGGVVGFVLGRNLDDGANRAATEQAARGERLAGADRPGEPARALLDRAAKPFPGAVLGNPAGTVTLVEFTDFACGYCRQSVADVTALIAANPDLKVVVRELPIIAPTSADAARWALAAAEQGKYPAFHQALFAAGGTDSASITAAAAAAGLDLARARRVSADPQVTAELQANLDLARDLGINGTPSWVVGDQVLAGAVGQAALGQAIAAARGR